MARSSGTPDSNVENLTADYGAVHVKMQYVFDAATKAVSPEHWIWDGVHPLILYHNGMN
jgi:hypothetical protein